jgi:hypothetical protein
MEYTAAEVAERLKQRAQEQGVDPSLAFALFVAENSADGEWNPNRKVRLDTTSPMKAFGVMQVMPQTHAGLIRNGYLPATNKMATLDEQLDAGLAAIKEKVASIGSSDPRDVAVRYNAISAVYPRWKQFGDAALPAETRHYITKVERAQKEAGMTPTPMGTPAAPMAAPAAGGLSGMLQTFTNSASNYTSLLEALLGQQQQTATEQQAAIRRRSEAESTAIRAKTDAGLAHDAQQQAILAQAGGNMLDPGSGIAAANSAFHQAAKAEEILGAQMQQLNSVSMMDNPLEWLMSQIKLNATAKQWEVVNQRKTAAAQTLNQIQAATKAQMDINPASVKELAIRGSEAAIAANKAKADVEAAAVETQVRNEQMNIARVKLSVEGDTLSRNFELRRMQEENYRYHEQLARQRGSEASDAAEVAPFNAVLSMYGKDPLGKLSHISRFEKGTQDLLVKLAGSGSMGQDIGQILRATNELGAFPSLERSKPALAAFLREVQTLSQEKLAEMRKDPEGAKQLAKLSPGEQLELAANGLWKTWETRAAATTMDRLKSDNPWKLKITAVANSPELQKNPISKFVQERMKTGAKDITDKEIIDYLAASPESPAVKAQQLQEFYSKGLKAQWEVMGIGYTGLRMADPKKDNARAGAVRYRVSPENLLDGYGVFGMFSAGRGMPELDLTNLADAQNLMVKALKAKQNPAEVTMQGASLPAPMDPFGLIPKKPQQ